MTDPTSLVEKIAMDKCGKPLLELTDVERHEVMRLCQKIMRDKFLAIDKNDALQSKSGKEG